MATIDIINMSLMALTAIMLIGQSVYFLNIRRLAKKKQMPEKQKKIDFGLPPSKLATLDEVRIMKGQIKEEYNQMHNRFGVLKQDFIVCEKREDELKKLQSQRSERSDGFEKSKEGKKNEKK